MLTFDYAYRRWWLYVFGVALTYAGNPGVAEDVTQETFLRAWERWDRLQPDAGLRFWLRRTAINLCRDYHRRARLLTWVVYAPARDARAAGATPEQVVTSADTCAGWLRALDGLPADQRAALRLAAGGATGPAIAQALGRSPGAVRLLLWRGRTHLRKVAQDYA